MCHPERNDTCICAAGTDEGLDCMGRRFPSARLRAGFTPFRMTIRWTLQQPWPQGSENGRAVAFWV
jgi:hypothetical protein